MKKEAIKGKAHHINKYHGKMLIIKNHAKIYLQKGIRCYKKGLKGFLAINIELYVPALETNGNS